MEVAVQLGALLSQFQTQDSKQETKEESKPDSSLEENEKKSVNLLLARILKLEEKSARAEDELKQEFKIGKPRKPPSIVGFAMLFYGIGIVSLIFSIAFTSTILAFIGLGLMFCGSLLLFIRPRKYVRSELLDSTALSSLKTVDRIMTELGYRQRGIYIPSSNPEKVVAFIPSELLTSIPKLEEIRNQTFIKSPRGAVIIPPGIELANLIESKLTGFKKRSIDTLKEQLPKLLIEDFEIFQDFDMQLDGNTVYIKFVESIYSDFCKKLSDTNICSSIGCPICSAMACILARALTKPVVLEKDIRSPDGRITESWYRILEV